MIGPASTQWFITRRIALLGAGVVLAAAALLQSQARERPVPDGGVDGNDARKVEVVTPQRQAMARTLDVPATLEAFEQADLYAKTSGYVAEVRVDIGDRVRAGDVLAVLDVPEMRHEVRHAEAVHRAREARSAQVRSRVETARAELRRSEADLNLRKITFDRKKQLREGNAIPQQELDQAQGELAVAQAQVAVGEARIAGAEADVAAAAAEVAMARAAVERLRTLNDYATIRAPFDGVISRRLVDRGMLVQTATANRTSPLFTVQRIDRLRIYIEVPETDVLFVRAGAAATVTPYGRSESSFEGRVSRIASALNPRTRTMRAEIDLANDDGVLMPGMYAQVVLAVDSRDRALTVPAAALLTEGDSTFVYTVKDGRAARTEIRTGLDDGLRVEVREGLADDARVIVAGKGLVSDGLPVQPVRAAGSMGG